MRLGAVWLDRLARELDGPGVLGLYLTGSHARGDADDWSDVDVHRVLEDGAPERKDFFFDGLLIGVGNETPAEVLGRMRDPGTAPYLVPVLRVAVPLLDRGAVATLKRAAEAFDWTDLSPTCDEWIRGALRTALMEAFKLRGALEGEVERAVDPLSGVLPRCVESVTVHHRLLVPTANRFLSVPAAALDPDDPWIGVARRTAGLDGPGTLRDRIEAGIRLLAATVGQVRPALDDETSGFLAEGLARLEA